MTKKHVYHTNQARLTEFMHEFAEFFMCDQCGEVGEVGRVVIIDGIAHNLCPTCEKMWHEVLWFRTPGGDIIYCHPGSKKWKKLDGGKKIA